MRFAWTKHLRLKHTKKFSIRALSYGVAGIVTERVILLAQQPIKHVFLPYPFIIHRAEQLIECQQIFRVIIAYSLKWRKLPIERCFVQRCSRHLIILYSFSVFRYEVYLAVVYLAYIDLIPTPQLLKVYYVFQYMLYIAFLSADQHISEANIHGIVFGLCRQILLSLDIVSSRLI